MARTEGSDILFRLIHSLTAEEKGYFKKFAKRHVSEGNSYLKLFDAVNKQTVFEEKTLKAKFDNYPSVKLYLRNMLMDSLVFYYKKVHPTVELLHEISKLYVLQEKGFPDEIKKEIKRSIELSGRKELFPLQRHLIEMNSLAIEPQASRLQMTEYKRLLDENREYDSEINTNELAMMKWYHDFRFPTGEKVTQQQIEQMEAAPARTYNAKRHKLTALTFMAYLQHDRYGTYRYTKEFVELAKEYKPKFNNIKLFDALSNHIMNCIDLSYFDEALMHIDDMINSEHKTSIFSHTATARGHFLKLSVLVDSGRFKEALQFLKTSDQNTLRAIKLAQDAPVNVLYGLVKARALLYTKNYQECWMALQQINLKEKHMPVNSINRDWTTIALQVQLEMKNFEIANAMARKSAKLFTRLGIASELNSMMLNFFKNVTAGNYKSLAKQHVQLSMEISKKDVEGTGTSNFAINFAYWLEEIAGGKTVQQRRLEDAEQIKQPVAKKQRKKQTA